MMMKLRETSQNGPNVHRSKWSRKYKICSTLSWLSIFSKYLIWRVKQMEHKKEQLYGCYIFSWSVPPPPHSTPALHDNLNRIGVRREISSLLIVKLWVICSGSRPLMTSAMKLTPKWCISRNHRASGLLNTLRLFGVMRFDATEYAMHMYSGQSLFRDYQNTPDAACTHIGVQSRTLKYTNWHAKRLR